MAQSIVEAATAFAHEYDRTMRSYNDQSLEDFATALSAFYNQKSFTNFCNGSTTVITDVATTVRSLSHHLSCMEKRGIGFCLTMEKLHVDPVSDGSALCRITWRLTPKNAIEPWTFDNIYGYRRTSLEANGSGEHGVESKETNGAVKEQRPDGAWEFVVADNDISGTLQRVPNLYQL